MSRTQSLKYNKFEIYSNEDSSKFGNISGGTPKVLYRESVLEPSIEISVDVLETGGAFPDGKTILEGLPLYTTERVQFEIELDENKVSFKNQDDLRVASIENIMESFSNVSYNLKVVSKEAFDNTLCDTRVKRKLEGKISTIVADIIQKDLGSDKPVYVDPTHNSYYDFGGDMSPFSKILELQTYAIPDGMSGKSAGYLFWQTSEGFHFRSLDKLFDKKGKYIKKFIENKKPGPPPIGYDGKILQSSRIRSINGLDQFETGSYGTILEVFDSVIKKYVRKEPSTPPPEGNGNIAGKKLPTFHPDLHGKATDKIQVRKNNGGSFSYEDKPERQVEKFTEEDIVVEEVIYQAKQNFRQKFTTVAEITIPADLSLHAGDLIECDFPGMTLDKTLEKSSRDSGIYMIADLCHYGDRSQSYTGLRLVRDSFG